MDEDSPGIPNVIAGILPMYCEIVVRAVYKIKICKGSRCMIYGKIINNEAKFPIPGIKPLIRPVRIPIMAGFIRSSIFRSV
jgi:hypothetical protein